MDEHGKLGQHFGGWLTQGFNFRAAAFLFPTIGAVQLKVSPIFEARLFHGMARRADGNYTISQKQSDRKGVTTKGAKKEIRFLKPSRPSRPS